MSRLTFTGFDLDFPAGSKNKTATLVTGDNDALLVDTGFTPVPMVIGWSLRCWTPASG